MVGAPRLGARPDHSNRLAARCCPSVRARPPAWLLCAPACARCCFASLVRHCCFASFLRRCCCAPPFCVAVVVRSLVLAVVARSLVCAGVACPVRSRLPWVCVFVAVLSGIARVWVRFYICPCAFVRAVLLSVTYCFRPLRRRDRVRVYSCSFHSHR